ncbi:MAG: GGDEF domain-containing protein [Lachnospiraceae bacterium]|nr:GGDEF domain-containing protein [Lachnospiraceae bacterium]
MAEFNINTFSMEDVLAFIPQKVGAVIVVDAKEDRIRTLSKKGIFQDFIRDDWTYLNLIENLWYHFSNSSETIAENYHVFLETSGKFTGNYSRRISLMVGETAHQAQMMVYPLAEDFYLFLLDELDISVCRDEDLTNKKVDAIQNIYLFSMYIDIVRDTTSSISVTEISDEVVNQQLKYSEWRNMIINMIDKEYQQQFLTETDPETLKKKYAPGQTFSFDCLMMNLEGKYIWVKLIFSRSETTNADDYRFVFMVQNIHKESLELRQNLKQYEMMASLDPLTSIYNHGRIETELNNAVVERSKNSRNASIMMLDIDFFKKVNDTYGHSVGDITLKHFAECILDGLKDKNAVLGRWGGEEFTAVCYETSLDDAKELAEALRTKVEAESFDKIGHITCSIGITEITANDNFDRAFERMDHALYEAKSAGRNCVKVG